MQNQAVTVSKLSERFNSTSIATLPNSFSNEVLYGIYQCRRAGSKEQRF
jgi:hypothetical protein